MSTVESNPSEALFSIRLMSRIALSIAVLAALVAALSLGGKWMSQELASGGYTESERIRHVLVGQDEIALPENVIRFAAQRRDGRADQLSIHLSWPELKGYSRGNADAFSDPRRASGVIFADFSQSVMSRDMSGRFDAIYSKLFVGEPEDGPAGLKIHALSRRSGFGEEKLLTGTLPDGTTYAVRCLLPAGTRAPTSADCLRDVRVGRDLTMLYRFSAELLPQWRAIDEALRIFAARHIVGTRASD